MDLNKYVINNDNSKPFHSSGFARIANGDRVGSTGGDSYSQRQQIDNNRRIIYGYNRSVIGSAYSVLRAKSALSTYKRPVIGNALLKQNVNLDSPNRHFVEPVVKKYDPFA